MRKGDDGVRWSRGQNWTERKQLIEVKKEYEKVMKILREGGGGF